MAGEVCTDSDDLGRFLMVRLTACTDLPIFIHILSDNHVHNIQESDDTRYGAIRWKSEQLYRRRLILVFQAREANKAILVIGMSVHEYCSIPTNSSDPRRFTRSYIQYIDTTGLFKPRNRQSLLTKSLVRTYISYCHLSLRLRSIHLLASAKPSFLFAGSEFNDGKGRLSTARLVKWWLGVVEDGCESFKAKINVWSPGEDLIEDRRTMERIERRNTTSNSHYVTWKYGPLFDPGAFIIDTVPFFEDDPKLKHFLSFYEDCSFSNTKMASIKVKNFQDTIGLRPEFRNQCHSTFIIIQFGDLDDGLIIASDVGTKSQQLASFAIKMLSNLTFESESKALDSSSKITSWLKFMGSRPIDVAQGHSEDAKRLQDNQLHLDENQPTNVQGLIKKRKTN